MSEAEYMIDDGQLLYSLPRIQAHIPSTQNPIAPFRNIETVELNLAQTSVLYK